LGIRGLVSRKRPESLWVLESYRRAGWTEAKILTNFPALRAADLVLAWAYIDSHRQDIEQAIRENEAA
jgi:uncharacterized protein (DUF433 family)